MAPPPVQNQISVSSSTSDARSRMQQSTHRQDARTGRRDPRSPSGGNTSHQRAPPHNGGEDEISSHVSRSNHLPHIGNPIGGRAIPPIRHNPFIVAITNEILPQRVKVSSLPQFDGTGDPHEHLKKFYAMADLYGPTDAAMCKMFRTKLSERALNWFNSLPTGSIEALSQLTDRFAHHFAINKEYAKTPAYLFTITQREGETLRNYIQRFVEASHKVPNVGGSMIAGIIQQNLKEGRFKESIAGRPPTTLEELLSRAEKHVRIEEASAPRGKEMKITSTPGDEMADDNRQHLIDNLLICPCTFNDVNDTWSLSSP
ncbi:PREDICTED: uncharacterized protein LOC105954886 [Erythranthe guttata]|uniref:uncharacterized protein LOC105954886 n=1 Tax=Erythranthe guttata TaxID=4155 RepID=UPI00064DFFE6|nr:PREDICTED: uncharacterized protein LOC105954886 [Erythranthe guttata]|eukprot:XP_012834024.1 PREDICTED: uncharacterized protein LOC105954886 [Erythranthe guttata]